jgi:hypothetical protein
MKRNSVFAVAREAMRQHSGWGRTWGNPEAKKAYDVVIIGAVGMAWPLPIIWARISASPMWR